MAEMVRQAVIDSTSKQVKRHGYCDFENDGNFDGGTETIIEKNWIFSPDIDTQDWYWNSVTEEFQQTPP